MLVLMVLGALTAFVIPQVLDEVPNLPIWLAVGAVGLMAAAGLAFLPLPRIRRWLDMIKALDMAAEMSGWGTPLPQGQARAIALEERGAEAGGSATISAMVHTVSVSRQGRVRLERVDVAHEMGFGLVNPLSVKKQIEGQITWFYNDAMHQANNILDGRIVENNFDRFSLSRIDEDPLEINIRFFPTEHWLVGMGHDRGTSVQSAIGDALFQITGKRFRDLPYRQHDLTWG
jgi:isoquinoline 1-oxidoreductase beta subunit